jgi:hypothetical protein
MNYRRNFQVGKDTDAPLSPCICPYSTEADVTTSGFQRVKQMEGLQGNQRGHHGLDDRGSGKGRSEPSS